jgi:hypothetical protein
MTLQVKILKHIKKAELFKGELKSLPPYVIIGKLIPSLCKGQNYPWSHILSMAVLMCPSLHKRASSKTGL